MASQKSLVATSQPAFRPDGMEDIDLMRGPMQVLFMDFGAGSSARISCGCGVLCRSIDWSTYRECMNAGRFKSRIVVHVLPLDSQVVLLNRDLRSSVPVLD